MKRIIVLLGAVAALTFAFAVPAGADDHSPTLSVEPSSVAEAGEYEFTITASDFAPTGGFLLPCEGAEGSLEVIAAGDPAELCDLAALTPYAVGDDGTWEATVTYTIPEIGLVIAAGDTGGDNASAALISVGAEAMEEEAMEEEAMEDEAMEEEAMEEEAMEEEAMEDDSLAETGVESSLLLVIGGTILLAGGLFVSTRRQHS